MACRTKNEAVKRLETGIEQFQQFLPWGNYILFCISSSRKISVSASSHGRLNAWKTNGFGVDDMTLRCLYIFVFMLVVVVVAAAAMYLMSFVCLSIGIDEDHDFTLQIFKNVSAGG